jgi:streptogramin lyase
VGTPLAGALVTVTFPGGLYAETIYADARGRFRLEMKETGAVTVRARQAYYVDASQALDLAGKGPHELDFRLVPLTAARAISDSLSASAHFARIRFEDPDEKAWFQIECLTCHQIGNAYTRAPKSRERWTEILTRMLGFYNVTDPKWIAHYVEVLSATFDGTPVDTHQQHVTDPAIYPARFIEWKLPQGLIAHDVEFLPADGRFYTVDQGNDRIYITDPVSRATETFKIPDGGIPIGGKFLALLGNPNPFSLSVSRGPHSLQLGPDGHFYTTDTVSGQIGEFDPRARTYVGHDIGGKALYPHTLRFDARRRVWFTLGVSNQVGYYDIAHDTMRIIDVPPDTDRPRMPALMPYGIDVNPRDGSVWYSSLMANRIGRIDSDTLEVRVYAPPTVGPRRMRFAADGTLWIPSFGDGALVHLDPATMRYERYVIPPLAAGEVEAPYAVGVHPGTQEIWITANMSDRMFRFLPGEKRFIAYPLPARGIYLRDIVFTPAGWVCAASSPVPAPLTVEGGMQEVACLDPGPRTP